MKNPSFPTLLLAVIIVTTGLYLLEQYDSRSAWLLAFIILLAVAYSYPAFGDEITQLLKMAPSGNQ